MTCLVNLTTGQVIVDGLHVQSTFVGRLRGLLFQKDAGPGRAMLLLHTGRVHTAGMNFALDLYFFDGDLNLLGRISGVRPWRLPRSPLGTRHILEVSHRSPKKILPIAVGDRVSLRFR